MLKKLIRFSVGNSALVVMVAVLALAFAGFSASFLGLPDSTSPWVTKSIAIGAVAVLTGVNVIGVGAGAWSDVDVACEATIQVVDRVIPQVD